QTTGFAPVQTPAWQVEVCVQALLSLQAVPFAALGIEQAPVMGLQTPASWHASLGVQTTGFAPVQTPAWQVEVCVQALLSLQAVPFAAFVNTQAALTQASVVQALLSLQSAFDPQPKPSSNVSELSLAMNRSWAAIAPRATSRSPPRTVLRATTIAVRRTSTPMDSELTAPSIVPLMFRRRPPAPGFAGPTRSPRSAIVMPVCTRTVALAVAATRASVPMRRFWMVYVPPDRFSVPLTVTLPYEPGASVWVWPPFTVIAPVPGVKVPGTG